MSQDGGIPVEPLFSPVAVYGSSLPAREGATRTLTCELTMDLSVIRLLTKFSLWAKLSRTS